MEERRGIGDIGALYGGDDCDAILRNLDEPILGGVAVGDDGAVVHGVADDTPRGVVFKSVEIAFVVFLIHVES